MRRSLLTGSYQPSGAISFITKRLSTLVRSAGLRSRSIQNHHERFPHQKRKPKRLVNVKTQRRAERGTNDVNRFAHNAGQHFPYSNEVSRSLIRRGWIGNHGLPAYTIQPGNVRTVLFPARRSNRKFAYICIRSNHSKQFPAHSFQLENIFRCRYKSQGKSSHHDRASSL